MITIPDRTALAVVGEFGEAGREWLDIQPGRLAALGERWRLTFEEPFGIGLPINIVFRVSRDNRPLILKTGFPHPEMFTEMAVLARWKCRPGCVQLIDSDEEAGAVLMDRIIPGTGFREFARLQSEHEASSQVRHVFERTPLRTDADDEFPSYTDWCSGAFANYRRQHSSDAFLVHIGHVEKLLEAAADRYESGWLLHGDLHHENILLCDPGDYVVVDPKGVIGPRLFEYGRFVHNFFVDQLPAMSAENILTQRLAALKGEFSESEILMVGYVDLVLSSCWSLNSGQTLKTETLELMELMSVLLTQGK